MQVKYYDIDKKHIVCIYDRENFSWDSFWANQVPSLQKGKDYFVTPVTSKYLSKGALILEGGCGPCNKVYALEACEFKVVGLDYAQNTLTTIKKHDSRLKLITGDVKYLPFKAESFDGYWSLGVIEHFYEGYHGVIKEAERILKKDGLLFVTFPYMSWLRKLKAALDFYPYLNKDFDTDEFYQFILRKENVIDLCKSYNFTLLEEKPFDGIKGIKDEIMILKPILQKIYDYKGTNIFLRGLRFLFSEFFVGFIRIGHSYLLVFRKK
jgi:SAM-dependent methyltransferase